MFKTVCIAVGLMAIFIAGPVLGGDLPRLSRGHEGVLHGGNSLFSKADLDSVFLLGPWGSGAQANGQFEDISGNPAWNGWTHIDYTETDESHWHISDFNAAALNDTPGNLVMYCGDETIPACSEDDVVGGYGNNWHEVLRFEYTVANPAEPCEVTVSGILSHDTEPGYDYTDFSFQLANGPVFLEALDGVGEAISFSYSFSYEPEDYVGPYADQVRFEIRFTSDGGWSDADCLFSSSGACLVDDLRVQCSNGEYDNTTDFQDGTGPDWAIAFTQGFGDFADLWVGLESLDPCHVNYSPQVAFIDDGTKYPGIGPSYCFSWCYGPNGYIVNVTGGRRINDNLNATIFNAIESPVVNLPGDGTLGVHLTFGVYRHESLTFDSPGIFYRWSVRSARQSSDIEQAPWLNRNFLYYGEPAYLRASEIVTDLMVPGATAVQIQLCVEDPDPGHWWHGNDGYPAPYFDNVRLVAFPENGPAIMAREMDLAQDNFPESGLLDMFNLAQMNVRFDSAVNKGDDEANDPGDSIVCSVASKRVGGELVENRLYYSVNRNPVFDSVRDAGWGSVGHVDGLPVVDLNGNIVPGEFAYDLPDSGFLFPGDILHYYLSASDVVDGNSLENNTLPVDLTGFGDFSHPLAYDTKYEVNCLPSLKADGSQPNIIFWNDFGSLGGENAWFSTLSELLLTKGVEYDVYHTNAPSFGVGNGLGGRATPEVIHGYNMLLYSSGDLNNYTITGGPPYSGFSLDAQLLDDWFETGFRGAFFTGDGLVWDLAASGAVTNAFLADYLGVTRLTQNIRPYINNQIAPLVLTEENNEIFATTTGWIAYGGCDIINTFDGAQLRDGSQTIARFTNPSGLPDYDLSAATLNRDSEKEVISMTFDFMNIQSAPGHPNNGRSARVAVLMEVLLQLGGVPDWYPTSVPAAESFMVTNYPNPFNPNTRIDFNLPQSGHFSLKVFNLRGELVKTLINEHREAGNTHIMWDGTNNQGGAASSGLYFYEARTIGEVKIGKMTLVK